MRLPLIPGTDQALGNFKHLGIGSAAWCRRLLRDKSALIFHFAAVEAHVSSLKLGPGPFSHLRPEETSIEHSSSNKKANRALKDWRIRRVCWRLINLWKEMCDANRYSILGLDDPVAPVRSRMVAFSKFDRQLRLDRQRPLSLVFAVPTGMGGVRVYLARRRRPLSLIAVGQRPISATRLIPDQKPIAFRDLT
jgi:hypothetical protein